MRNYHGTHQDQIREWELNGFIYIPGNILNSPESDVFYMLDTTLTEAHKSLLYRFSPNGPGYVSRCWVTGNLFQSARTPFGRRWKRQQLMNYMKKGNIRENLNKYLSTALNYRSK